MTVRIVLADDQQIMRSGLRMILENEQDFEVVAEASDGVEAVDLTRRLRPSVVVMDIRMPRLDGIEATRRLIGSSTGAPRVLILTTFDADEYVYAALRAGASGFLLKTAPPDQLVDGVRLVAGGEALLAPSVTRRLIEDFVARSPRPAAASPSHSANLRATPVTARRDGTPGLLVPALELALDDLARHLSLSAVDAPPGHCGALLSISPNRSSTSDSAFEYTAAIRDQLPSTLRTLLRRT
jgi:DNA-binding NarL/FixJ family response regulator